MAVTKQYATNDMKASALNQNKGKVEKKTITVKGATQTLNNQNNGANQTSVDANKLEDKTKKNNVLDFSFKNILDLAELKTVDPNSGKKKHTATENQAVVEEDKKFGDDEQSKKDGEENEKEEKENEENKEGEEGEKQVKDKKEENKKQERKEPEVIRVIPSNTAQNIIVNNHVPMTNGVTKTVGGKTVEEQKTQSQKALKKVSIQCRSLILGYNKIRSIDKFFPIIDSIMFDCVNLGFLDLSHNYLQALQYDFSHFPNLKILYLHCNYIKDLREIQKIRSPLISLTIHGNPVESIPGFRQFIIAIIPTLKNLDTAPISKKERDVLDTNIKKLLNRIPPPVQKAAEPPQESVNNNNNNNENKNN
ncbi:hypothetical protein ABPG74_005879 [Tetrahymena malaccensis]